jgi:hypothetical protein
MDKKYTVTDHNDGKKYDITEHMPEPALDPNGYPIFPKNTAMPITEAAKLHQQDKSTDELIAEARKLFAKPSPNVTPKPLTKKEQEFEQHKKEIDKQYRGKIPYTIFEEIERAFDY